MTYDIILKNGAIIDGTKKPRYEGDLAIKDGKIAAMGSIKEKAGTTIDASDMVIAPGFVDIHTHYDAQILWDNKLSVSPWHGVTTALMGNCGFGIAPTKPEDRETIMRTLEKVEGMSYSALKKGLGTLWPFETFPEYLDVLEKRGCAINIAAYIGHTPLRTYVMGEEACLREANDREIEKMKAIVRESMAAGAMGLSTSYAATHHGSGGRPVPSRLAAFSEIDSLVGAMKESNKGILQTTFGKGFFLSEYEKIALKHNVPITWSALLAGMAGKGSHKRILETVREQQEKGLSITPQVACRPIMFDFHLDEPYPFEILSIFHKTMKTDKEGRKKLYQDPDFRAKFKEESLESAKNVNAGWASRAVISKYDPDPSLVEKPLCEVAKAKGLHPVDLMLDMSLETNLESRFRFAFINHDEEEVEELITDSKTVIALSDAGAHADQLCDAGYASHLLGYWVREKGVMSLEDAVYNLTKRPASVAGFLDRGQLKIGNPADVVLFNPATISALALRRVCDLPGKNERVVCDAAGIEAVIVNGKLIRRHNKDQPLDHLPGKLLRSTDY